MVPERRQVYCMLYALFLILYRGRENTLSRMKIRLTHLYNRESQGSHLSNISVPLPRLWMILLILAFPFLAICTDYFEALERSGTVGAIVADMLMPVSIISYTVLLYVLKKRKI